MNTNDNTDPCPTCSMAVNKSAIKLAARIAELEAELAIAHKANMHVDGKVAAVKLAKAEARVTELETSITNFFAATKEAWGAWKYPTYLREAYEALRLESKLIGAPGPSVSVPETSGTAESNTSEWIWHASSVNHDAHGRMRRR